MKRPTGSPRRVSRDPSQRLASLAGLLASALAVLALATVLHAQSKPDAAAGGAPAEDVGKADDGAHEAGDGDASTAHATRADRCLSEEELSLMSSLARRNRDLEARARDLDDRERRLHELEGHVETRIRAYSELQNKLKQEAERRLANAQDRAKGLAKIYESMSPSDAAERLSQMERDVAVEILRSMKGPAAGKVLASLDSDKAVDLSQGYVAPDASPDPPSKSENP